MPIRDRIRKIKHLRNRYFIAVLENPSDVQNIGSAIRNVSAFGVEKLYVVGPTNIVKDFKSARENKLITSISVGANKWAFVKHFSTTADCLAYLRKNLYTIAVTSSHIKGAKNINLYEGNFTQKRLAVWFGNEAQGVSEEAVRGADMCIQIPMGGIVESLNLGSSTGIVLGFIGYQRLKYVFEHRKVKFQPAGLRNRKLASWEKFIEPL